MVMNSFNYFSTSLKVSIDKTDQIVTFLILSKIVTDYAYIW